MVGFSTAGPPSARRRHRRRAAHEAATRTQVTRPGTIPTGVIGGLMAEGPIPLLDRPTALLP